MSSPTLLAWCSLFTNPIGIVDLNTKESYASFDGVKLSDTSKFYFLKCFVADML